MLLVYTYHPSHYHFLFFFSCFSEQPTSAIKYTHTQSEKNLYPTALTANSTIKHKIIQTSWRCLCVSTKIYFVESTKSISNQHIKESQIASSSKKKNILQVVLCLDFEEFFFLWLCKKLQEHSVMWWMKKHIFVFRKNDILKSGVDIFLI